MSWLVYMCFLLEQLYNGTMFIKGKDESGTLVEWRWKPKYLNKSLSQCLYVHKFLTDSPGIDPGPPRWETGDENIAFYFKTQFVRRSGHSVTFTKTNQDKSTCFF